MGLREKPLFRELPSLPASWKEGKEDVLVKVLKEFERLFLFEFYSCWEINIYRHDLFEIIRFNVRFGQIIVKIIVN